MSAEAPPVAGADGLAGFPLIAGHANTKKSATRMTATMSPTTIPTDESSVVPEGLLMIVAINFLNLVKLLIYYGSNDADGTPALQPPYFFFGIGNDTVKTLPFPRVLVASTVPP